jgi:type III pantothenate kinase
MKQRSHRHSLYSPPEAYSTSETLPPTVTLTTVTLTTVTLNRWCACMVNAATEPWLALMIGNSRLHWGYFVENRLEQTWDLPYPSTAAIAPTYPMPCADHLPLWVASVVPTQTAIWQLPALHTIELSQIPLGGLYPTLGIDRALALWGAAQTQGLPALVIDAGTALTFTAATAEAQLVGGAILPGLQLQLRSLHEHTAALPSLTTADLNPQLPCRWSKDTTSAIQSGILYTLVAGLNDFVITWLQQYPQSAILLTGGDRVLLYRYLQHAFPETASCITVDPHLIFWGIRALRQATPFTQR